MEEISIQAFKGEFVLDSGGVLWVGPYEDFSEKFTKGADHVIFNLKVFRDLVDERGSSEYLGQELVAASVLLDARQGLILPLWNWVTLEVLVRFLHRHYVLL